MDRIEKLGSYELSPAQMGHAIDKALPLTGSHLLLLFGGSEWRVFDVQPFAQGPALKGLANQGAFEKVFVERGTVRWPDGEALDPDVCYWESIPAVEYFGKFSDGLASVAGGSK